VREREEAAVRDGREWEGIGVVEVETNPSGTQS
jgi:hypothetical protein